jgi:hypothetical protein
MTRTQLRRYIKGEGYPEEEDDGDVCAEAMKPEFENARPFTNLERERIQSMFSHCNCGGNFYDEGHKRARIRCPECLSSDVEKGMMTIMYD